MRKSGGGEKIGTVASAPHFLSHCWLVSCVSVFAFLYLYFCICISVFVMRTQINWDTYHSTVTDYHN